MDTSMIFDGATATSNKRRQMEIGTVEVMLAKHELAFLKSSHNCHQWLIYFGEEDTDTLALRFKGIGSHVRHEFLLSFCLQISLLLVLDH